ncbi:olfactory receptor 14I1-like [Dasypus novemcinctus]|uniref:olfactory receptor 14I1-like n=1 Tax=Dasypus novemcinctus TaxID=9361 RepID=UPI00266018D1|nr:olfactory receptor 14I1-like [Dasypus novemcinctus]
MDNLTIFTEFLLMDVSASREIQILQGLLFLVIYLGALTGNLLTATVIVTDPHLHSPMYFFIGNLSLIDLCCISVIVPKLVVNSLTGSKLISLPECAAQIFLFIFFISTELAFLVVMSYDRYVAICHPLHYGLTITPYVCTQATCGSWASGLVYSAFHTGIMFRLPFTKSNVIQQYFCDIPQILRISSSEVWFSESVALAISAFIIVLCSAFLFKSYIDIFSLVLRMQSVEARNKALSTCTPQLAILILFVISGLIAVFGPNASEASFNNLLTAMFYTMVPPLINPIIYSLRNREMNTSIGRMFHKYFEFPRVNFLNKKF